MLFLIIWFILAQFIFAGAIYTLDAATDINTTALMLSPWYIIGLQLTVLVLPLFVWLFLKKDSIKPHLPNWKLGKRNIILLIALSFFIQPAMMFISGISGLFSPNIVSDMIYSFMEHPLWLILLATAVTPAICEELVFRGYLQSQHRDRSIKQAAILNGLFFAIIHLNLQQFAYTFVLGVAFAYLVYYTRNIWAAIIPHFIVNATQGILGRLAFSVDLTYLQEATGQAEPQRLISSITPEAEAIIIMGVITLLVSPIIYTLFKEIIVHNKWRVQDHSPFAPSAPPPPTKPPFLDRYAICVIVIYVAFMLLINII